LLLWKILYLNQGSLCEKRLRFLPKSTPPKTHKNKR
jgi:hypothetical protein